MSHEVRGVHVQPLAHRRYVRAEGEGDRAPASSEDYHLVRAGVDGKTSGLDVVGDEGGRSHVIQDVTLPTSSGTSRARRHLHFGRTKCPSRNEWKFFFSP